MSEHRDNGLILRSARWEIAEDLRRSILNGEMPRGHRLPTERELAERYGVARSTLREALQVLRDEGYIATVRGRSGGTVVTDLVVPEGRWYQRIRERPSELDELFDFRIAIETRSAYLAATRRTEQELGEMQRFMDMLHEQPISPTTFREADAGFHDAVARASGNRRLVAEIRAARGEIFFPFDTLPHPVYVAPTLEGHSAILNCIRLMNGRTAADAMESHLEHTRIELRTIIFMSADRQSDSAGEAGAETQ